MKKWTLASVVLLMASFLTVCVGFAIIHLFTVGRWDAFAVACVAGSISGLFLLAALTIAICAWQREGQSATIPKVIVWAVGVILLVCGVVAYLKLTPPGI